jgi:hypothetical protein
LHGLWTGAGGVALRLTNHGVDARYTVTANGEFSFPDPLDEGTSYVATVESSPASHDCMISSSASGIADPMGATSIEVACAGPAVSVTLSVAGRWSFDPTLDVQPVFPVSVLSDDVSVTIGSPDGAVISAQVAHEPVSLGSPSPPLPLVFGVTMIEVDLVAQGALAKSYQLVISRAAGVALEPTATM